MGIMDGFTISLSCSPPTHMFANPLNLLLDDQVIRVQSTNVFIIGVGSSVKESIAASLSLLFCL